MAASAAVARPTIGCHGYTQPVFVTREGSCLYMVAMVMLYLMFDPSTVYYEIACHRATVVAMETTRPC